MTSVVATRLASFRLYARKEEEEERRLGVCTKLKLYDPWTIRKTLFKSDVDNSSCLLLPKEGVKKYVIPHIGYPCRDHDDFVGGRNVMAFDMDTRFVHQLVLKRWSTNSFVLTRTWVTKFLSRRGLEKDDEIGLFWDMEKACFCFDLLRKAVDPPY